MVRYPIKTSLGYMWVTSILGIVLGGLMLFYPGGTMNLMSVGFRIFQGILTVFIAYYVISEAYNQFKAQSTVVAAAYILLGLIFTALIWFLDVRFLYYVVSLYLLLTGLIEIFGAMTLPVGMPFLILLGIVDVLFAVVIFLHPVILAYVIAWYVLFWGISRLCLALELRKSLHARDSVPSF